MQTYSIADILLEMNHEDIKQPYIILYYSYSEISQSFTSKAFRDTPSIEVSIENKFLKSKFQKY